MVFPLSDFVMAQKKIYSFVSPDTYIHTHMHTNKHTYALFFRSYKLYKP